MRFPLSTGQAARILGVTEPQLAETVRRGQVNPEPLLLAGRRLWEPRHLLQAAERIGVLDPELRKQLEAEVPRVL